MADGERGLKSKKKERGGRRSESNRGTKPERGETEKKRVSRRDEGNEGGGVRDEG